MFEVHKNGSIPLIGVLQYVSKDTSKFKMLMTVPFPLWNPARSFPRFHLYSVDEDSDVYFSG